MNLVRMQISGFLSYLQKVNIDFTEFDLACISGANGAGKSTLLEAITWVLFGEARRKDDAIINLHAPTAEVILDFDYENTRYQVQRSKTRDKSTLLEFRVQDAESKWKPMTEATLRGTEELIRKTLHLDYETFINASFFLQGRADQFAQQRPGDRKRILSGILGLDIWEEYKEEASRRRRNIESELAVIDAVLAEIELELAQEQERKVRLKELEKELAGKTSLFGARKDLLEQTRLVASHVAETRKAVDKQATEISRLENELEGKEGDLDIRLQERQNYQMQIEDEPLVRKEVQNWETARLALAEWDKLAANFHQYESQRNDPLLKIEGERASLQQELATLTLKNEEMTRMETGLPGLLEQVESLQSSINMLNDRLAARFDIEVEIRRLQDAKVQAKAENAQLKTEMDELKERLSRLAEIEGVICPTCEKPLNVPEREKLIEDLNVRGKEKGDAHRENVKLMSACEEQITQKESELQELQRADAELKTQQRAYDLKSEEQRKNHLEIDVWKVNGQKRLEEISLTLRTNAYAQEAREALAQVDAKLKDLGYDAAAHEQVRKAEQEGSSSREKLVQLEQAKSALVPLEREIKDLQKAVGRDETHLATLTEEYKTADTKLQEEIAGLPDMNRLESEYYESQEEMNRAISAVGYSRNQVDVLDRQREQKAARTEEKRERLGQVTNLKILERAFGKDGIPALLIEQALPDIQEHANDILDRLSAGDMSITFETQREFKDKKREDRRETLDILIRDSAGERPYELFSGGEAFRINFAIRLALSRVLAQRAGARLQTLVIDEGFGSQDADGRQRLIEAINLVRRDFSKVLVITHLEELKDAFSARIEVTKTPTGSQVQVVAA